MSTAPQFEPVTVDEYLRGELNARRKHEYVDGVVYAMVGTTNAHNRIATNATIALGRQLRGKPCQVFNSDTKIRVRRPQGTRFYYPDALVACRLNPATDTFQDAPVVIVEVISQSTRRTDENEKREAYLSIDSLGVCLLVEQATVAVVVYRRTENGFTREVNLDCDAIVSLPEIECELSLVELYENVEFPPLASDEESNQY